MKNNIWHPFTQMKTAQNPLHIVRAKDTLLFDENGKSYIDANSSWWVNIHGHGNEAIGAAIQEQFEQLDHVLLAGVTHPKAIELSHEIIELLGTPFSKVFFSDDGSTANEIALKMAIQYWHNKGIKKSKIIALEGAYHGDTFGAMSVGERGYFNRPFEDYFFEVDFLPFPNLEMEEECFKRAEELITRGDVACLILEPLIQGSAGMRTYRAEFLDRLVRLAQENDVLVIFDEVMTGWGRTGSLFAFEQIESRPDIICLSKGLTGGVLPLGLTVTNDKIYTAFLSDDKQKALLHGHSFTGSALACAAACANINLFKTPILSKRIKDLNDQWRRLSNKWKEDSSISEIRHIGTILALDLKQNQGAYFSPIRDQIIDFFLSRGVFVRPLGNVLFFNPPYCITRAEIAHIEETTDLFLAHIKNPLTIG